MFLGVVLVAFIDWAPTRENMRQKSDVMIFSHASEHVS